MRCMMDAREGGRVANSQQPPKPDGSGMIVMTRLNTIGLRKLANGGLVESRPPAPLPAAGSPARHPSSRPKSLDDALKLPELRASDVTLTPPPQPARASTPPPARASAPPPAPVTAQAAAKAIADRLDALFDDATSRVDPASLGIP